MNHPRGILEKLRSGNFVLLAPAAAAKAQWPVYVVMNSADAAKHAALCSVVRLFFFNQSFMDCCIGQSTKLRQADF